MKLKIILPILILSLTISGCEKEDTLEGKEIPYNILERGSFPVSEDNSIDEQYLFFKDKDEWESFLHFMESKSPNKAEELKELTFDFNSKTLLIIISEFGNFCCKDIVINKVYRDKGMIYVAYEIDDSTGTESDFHQSYLLFEVNKN